MIKQTIRSLLISKIFPPVLITFFVVVVYLNNLINPLCPIPPIAVPIILLVLAVLAIVRGWWIEEKKLPLIKEYKSLVILLGKLDGTQILKLPEHPLNLELKQRCLNINRKLKELNGKLDKLINNPYRLLYPNPHESLPHA